MGDDKEMPGKLGLQVLAAFIILALCITAIFGAVKFISWRPGEHSIVIKNVGDSEIDFELYLNGDLLDNGTVLAGSEHIYTLKCQQVDNVLTLFADGTRYENIYGGGGLSGPPAMPETVYFVVQAGTQVI